MSYDYNNNGGCCNGGLFGGVGAGFGIEALILLLFFGALGGGMWGGFGGFGGGRGLEQATTTAAETAALVGQQQVADRVASINTGVDAVNGIATANGVKIDGVKDVVTNGFFANQTNLCELGNNIAQQFNTAAMNGMQNHNNLTAQLTDMRFANQQCCCDTRQLIQSSFCDLRHQLASDKCETLQAIAASESRLAAQLASDRMERLQDKLAAANERNSELKAQIDNQNQTNTLLAAIQQSRACVPCPPPCNPCNPCFDGVQRAVNDALGTRIGELLFPATTATA